MEKERIWIEQGYSTFAYGGPRGLKVERLAKSVGKSKSSFYHHFADLEVFTELLLNHHLEQAQLIAEKEGSCESLDGLIAIFLDHKTDLLFNRQLRFERSNPSFEACFSRINEISLPAFVPLWSKIIGLEQNKHLAGLVLQLTIENFYLQITEQNLNERWLRSYIEGIKEMVKQFH